MYKLTTTLACKLTVWPTYLKTQLHISATEAVQWKWKTIKNLSCTSLPKAPINWGLEWLPNITVQINQFLTRRLTYFLCIKCPLIKLPIWQNPRCQILGSPLMVICSSWATTNMMCVLIMTGGGDKELAAGLSSYLYLHWNVDPDYRWGDDHILNNSKLTNIPFSDSTENTVAYTTK